MAYLGRQGVTAPLTSADIPDNSITSAKIVDDSVTTVKILDDNVTAAKIPAGAVSSDVLYLENNTSTQTLSGTYSTERLYFNDSYQLTGDVTVNNHLALGSIADEDIEITQDSTERTITGTGTLEAGNVLQDTHRTSLTDMTGELGSAVTGSPNLNLTTGTLGSGVTFPAGHVIQTVFNKLSASEAGGMPSRNSSAWGVFSGVGFKNAITPLKSNSDILINLSLIIGDSDDATLYFRLYDNTNSQYIGVEGAEGLFGGRQYKSWNSDVISYTYLYENPTIASTPNSIEIEVHTKSGATVYLNRRMQDNAWGRHTSTMILQEISR